MRTLQVFAFAAVCLALAIAAPADNAKPKDQVENVDDAYTWFAFPTISFSDFFAPFWKLFPDFSDLGTRIINDEKQMQIIISVKGYKQDDIDVTIKNNFITIQGGHETKEDEKDLFSSQFLHTYTLPTNASSSEVTAELSSNDYLIITIPLNGETKSDSGKREVPITKTDKPYEFKGEPGDETPVEAEDDRKEQTTPANDAASTDKENTIPHGDEAL